MQIKDTYISLNENITASYTDLHFPLIEYISDDDKNGQVDEPENLIPEWIQLLPEGKEVTGRDGRKFNNNNPKQVLKNIAENGKDVPVDIQHASEMPWVQDAPAVGWIKEYKIENSAIWGRVEWNWQGKYLLEDKSYRYISPAILVERKTNNIVGINSAGLTNNPNLKMKALNSKQNNNKKEDKMDRELLCKLLGISDKATEQEIEIAINRMKTVVDSASASTSDLNKQITSLNSKIEVLEKKDEKSVSLQAYVPRGDYDIMVNRAVTAETKINEVEKANKEKEIIAIVDKAINDKKIAPANKDFYVSVCSKENGVEEFNAFIENSPALMQNDIVVEKSVTTKTNKKLTENQIEICRNLGLTEEQFLAIEV